MCKKNYIKESIYISNTMLLHKIFYLPIIISIIFFLPYILVLVGLYCYGLVSGSLFASIQCIRVTVTSYMALLQSIQVSNCLIIVQTYIINSWLCVSIIGLFSYIKHKFKV